MKKLLYLAYVIITASLVCSCSNTGEQKPRYKEENKTNVEEKKDKDKGKGEKSEEFRDHFGYKLLGSYNYSTFLREIYGGTEELSNYVFKKGYSLDGLIICLDDFPIFFNDDEDYYNDYIYEWSLALKIAKEYMWQSSHCYSLDWGDYKSYKRVLNTGDTIDIVKGNIYIKNDVGGITDTIYTITRTFDENGEKIDEQAFDRKGNPIRKGDTLSVCEYLMDIEVFQYYLSNCVYCLPGCIENCASREVKEIFKKNYYDLKEAHIYQPDKGYGYRKYPIDKGKYGYDYVYLFRIKGEKYKGIPDGALGIYFIY